MTFKNIKIQKSDYVVWMLLAVLILFSCASSRARSQVEVAEISIMSVFNPNRENPKLESVELYVSESGYLDDYKLVSDGARIIALPYIEVEKGNSIRVFTGKGECDSVKVYMGLDSEIWESKGTMFLYRGEKLIEEFDY